MKLVDLFKNIKDYENKEIEVNGWIRSHRKQAYFGFIDFSDGTSFKHLQIVYTNELSDFEEISKLHIGSSIKVIGTLVKSEGAGQDYELKAKEIILLGDCSEDYPLQAKGRPTREYLREIAYLRPRTNLCQAVFRIRSVAAMAIHT